MSRTGFVLVAGCGLPGNRGRSPLRFRRHAAWPWRRCKERPAPGCPRIRSTPPHRDRDPADRPFRVRPLAGLRAPVTEKILSAERMNGPSREAIAERIGGASKIIIAAACLGRMRMTMRMTREQAAKAAAIRRRNHERHRLRHDPGAAARPAGRPGEDRHAGQVPERQDVLTAEPPWSHSNASSSSCTTSTAWRPSTGRPSARRPSRPRPRTAPPPRRRQHGSTAGCPAAWPCGRGSRCGSPPGGVQVLQVFVDEALLLRLETTRGRHGLAFGSDCRNKGQAPVRQSSQETRSSVLNDKVYSLILRPSLLSDSASSLSRSP